MLQSMSHSSTGTNPSKPVPSQDISVKQNKSSPQLPLATPPQLPLATPQLPLATPQLPLATPPQFPLATPQLPLPMPPQLPLATPPPPDFAKAIKALNKVKLPADNTTNTSITPVIENDSTLAKNTDVSLVNDENHDTLPLKTPPVVTATSSGNLATTASSLFPATLQELFKAANDKKNLQQANKAAESTMINESFTNKIKRDLGMMPPPQMGRPLNHMAPPVPIRGPSPGIPPLHVQLIIIHVYFYSSP